VAQVKRVGLVLGAGGTLGATRMVGALGAVQAPRGRTWIMAVDYDCGRRVAFERPDVSPAPLADAVVASCSIPGPNLMDARRRRQVLETSWATSPRRFRDRLTGSGR
jgi:predicted acylesterase/phospholipase RssA